MIPNLSDVLTAERLHVFLPSLANPETWAKALVPACVRFEINTKSRLAAFLAQAAHESGEFQRLVENLNYSAKRLTQVWPGRFPTLAAAEPYARQPEKLANFVYASRNGNGDAASGDGWTFRGRGPFMITGLLNYRSSEAGLRAAGVPIAVSFEVDPDQVAEPAMGALTAARFFKSRDCNRLADLNTENSFDEISEHINGGKIGLAERRAYWIRAKEALNG